MRGLRKGWTRHFKQTPSHFTAFFFYGEIKGCSGRTGLQCSRLVGFISLEKIAFLGKKDGDDSQSSNFLQNQKDGPEPDGSREVSHRAQWDGGAGAGECPGQHRSVCVSVCPKAGVPASLEPHCHRGTHRVPGGDTCGPIPCTLVVPGTVGAPGLSSPCSANPAWRASPPPKTDTIIPPNYWYGTVNPMMGKADMYQFGSCGWKKIARKRRPVLRNWVELGARAGGGAGRGITALQERHWPQGSRTRSFRASLAALGVKLSRNCEIREISACASAPALLAQLPLPKGGDTCSRDSASLSCWVNTGPRVWELGLNWVSSSQKSWLCLQLWPDAGHRWVLGVQQLGESCSWPHSHPLFLMGHLNHSKSVPNQFRKALKWFIWVLQFSPSGSFCWGARAHSGLVLVRPFCSCSSGWCQQKTEEPATETLSAAETRIWGCSVSKAMALFSFFLSHARSQGWSPTTITPKSRCAGWGCGHHQHGTAPVATMDSMERHRYGWWSVGFAGATAPCAASPPLCGERQSCGPQCHVGWICAFPGQAAAAPSLFCGPHGQPSCAKLGVLCRDKRGSCN